MKNFFKFFGIITLTAVIGFGLAACGGGAPFDGEGTWSDVTSLDQIDGTWKGTYSETFDLAEIMDEEEFSVDITVKMTVEITVTIDAVEEKMSGSIKTTMAFSGADIEDSWDDITEGIKEAIIDESELDEDDFVIENYTISWTMDIEDTISLDDMQRIQINPKGTELRLPAGTMGEDSPAITLKKQP